MHKSQISKFKFFQTNRNKLHILNEEHAFHHKSNPLNEIYKKKKNK